MEAVLITQTSLYWSKLGKWQILAVLSAMITFFVTLHFMGDKESAGQLAAIVSIVTLLVVVVPPATNGTITLVTVLIGGIATTVAVAVSIFIAALAFPHTTRTVMIFAAVAFALLATIYTLLVAEEMKKCGMKKRIVWLSFAAEFVIILLPMSLAH